MVSEITFNLSFKLGRSVQVSDKQLNGSDSGFPTTLSVEQGIDYLAVVIFDNVSEDVTVIQQLSLPFNNIKNLGYENIPIE